MLRKTTYKVKIEFTTPVLGTVPKDKAVYEEFILDPTLSDEEKAEELETVPESDVKGHTGFHTENGIPHLRAYMVKGFMKSACGYLWRIPGMASYKKQAYKKIISGVEVAPRLIPLQLPGALGSKEVEALRVLPRPLRAQTAQGERICIAVSDVAEAGTKLEFDLIILGNPKDRGHPIHEGLLYEWFDFGATQGFGQWRNSGDYGTFTYEMERLD